MESIEWDLLADLFDGKEHMDREDINRMKYSIDNMDFREMFLMWRHEPIGSRWFIGEVGEYFAQQFDRRRELLAPEEFVAISKAIGW